MKHWYRADLQIKTRKAAISIPPGRLQIPGAYWTPRWAWVMVESRKLLLNSDFYTFLLLDDYWKVYGERRAARRNIYVHFNNRVSWNFAFPCMVTHAVNSIFILLSYSEIHSGTLILPCLYSQHLLQPKIDDVSNTFYFIYFKRIKYNSLLFNENIFFFQ